MIYNHIERIRKEIASVKDTILDARFIQSIDDYRARTGYLMGLQKALELFDLSRDEDDREL